MGGDFNEIRNLGERQGSSNRDKGMADFNDFIDGLEVIDLPMFGTKFTWANSDNVAKWSRLDRFLIHSEWLSRFIWKQWGLSRILSDHCPVILKVDARDWGPKPFRFLNAWTLHPNFKQMVKECWESSIIQGWAGFRVARKLKGLKRALKSWNKEVFGGMFRKVFRKWKARLIRLVFWLSLVPCLPRISTGEKSLKRNSGNYAEDWNGFGYKRLGWTGL